MATRRFHVLLEWDPESQVWVAYVPALDHPSTFGETRQEAIEHTREAILGYLEAAKKEGLQVPAGGTQAELVEVEIAAA